MRRRTLLSLLLAFCLMVGCSCALAEGGAPIVVVTYDQDRFVPGEPVTARVEVRGPGAEGCTLTEYGWRVYEENGEGTFQETGTLTHIQGQTGQLTFTSASGIGVSLSGMAQTADGTPVDWIAPDLYTDGIAGYTLTRMQANGWLSINTAKQHLRITMDQSTFAPGQAVSASFELFGLDVENCAFANCQVSQYEAKDANSGSSYPYESHSLEGIMGPGGKVTVSVPMVGDAFRLEVTAYNADGEMIWGMSDIYPITGAAYSIAFDQEALRADKALGVQYQLPTMEGYALGEYEWLIGYPGLSGRYLLGSGKLESLSGQIAITVSEEEIGNCWDNFLRMYEELDLPDFQLDPAGMVMLLRLNLVPPSGDLIVFEAELPVSLSQP